MIADTLNVLASEHVGDAIGDHRAACPICAKAGRDDAVNVTVKPDGSVVAVCHRCEATGTARPERVNGARRPAARTRSTRPAEDFKTLWESGAEPGEAFEHEYLQRKQVQPHGIRIAGDLLLIPMRNVAGELVGVQTINADGKKLYRKGTHKTGAYHLLGKPDERIVIAEGYATASSIFAATGCAVAVAFDAGNIIHVTKMLHAKYPTTTIILAADDDAGSAGNPGLTAAVAAARAVGGLVAVPDFGADRPDKVSDFNDLAGRRGPEAVRQCIAQAKAPDHPDDGASSTLPRPSYIIHESASTALLACNYAVKGIIDLQSTVLIYGATNTGKTFFVLDLHLHVAHGLPWRGRRVRKCLVLYIAAEAGIALQRRVRAWLDHHHVDPGTGAFWIRQRGISLMEIDAADQIEAELSTVQNPDHLPIIVVVDTLSRSLAGGDENRDLPTAIAVCDRLRDRLQATLVLVHHSGKTADKGPRGHSSLLAAVDTSLCVGDEGGSRAAVVDKARDAVNGTSLPFSLRPVNLGTDDDGDVISTCIVEHEADAAGPVRSKPGRALPNGATLVISAIQKATGDYGIPGASIGSDVPAGVRAVRLSDVRDEHRRLYGERDDDAKRGGHARQAAFSRGLDRLQAQGLVSASGSFVWQVGTK